eukprot:8919229-Pyramimonas_sp.AAC.1
MATQTAPPLLPLAPPARCTTTPGPVHLSRCSECDLLAAAMRLYTWAQSPSRLGGTPDRNAGGPSRPRSNGTRRPVT